MQTYTVLHVEDEPADRMIVSAAFKKAAPNVLLKAAIDGEQAIAYLSGQGVFANRELHPMPLLVLLDIKLPRKSGLEVLEWIRKHPTLKSMPVLMLTSSSESNDLDRAYALGANSYLVKTVDLPAMREIVRGIGEYAAIVAAPPTAEKLSAPD
ncbi:MAG TPA: response regulator [Planctomycetota bacterium]|nr:response regulator [Planctomycetota bacterium]